MTTLERPLLLLGDCLEQLKELPDNSVDSVVTDPPYGLSFMGKKWDYDVPSVEVWAECLRVLKPGGHLLAFAGTRTQHRMAVRIEDAGFEIRDMIAWVYSSGFPKSHNFGCKCSRDALSYTHEKNLSREQEAECIMHTVWNRHVSQTLDSSEGRGQVLQQSLPEQSASIEGWKKFSATEVWERQPSMERRGDILEEEGKLQIDQVCSMPSGISADGSKGRIRNGASIDNGENVREMFNQNGSGASCKPQPAGQSTGELGAVSEQRCSQERGMASDQTCPKCGKMINWQGWGTALKPALEPITVARKPLIGTVAKNVLEHGTGAINVDGCRVGTEGGGTNCTNRDENGKCRGHRNEGRSTSGETFHGPEQSTTIGRWPANLIHDGSDEVLAGFPTTGASKASNRGRGYGDGCFTNDCNYDGAVRGYDDVGGSAARFFYCAKASKRDRDEGLDRIKLVTLELESCESNSIQQDQSATLLVDMETLLLKATAEFGTNIKKGNEWSTVLFGNRFKEQFQEECRSTTLTETNLTIESKILNALMHSITSDCIPVANLETENGGSRAVNAESCNTLTFTISEKMALALGVSNVQLKMLLKISVKDGRNIHSTVKPTDLMRYLCRLVTPPNGTVLDPFMGSGSTGKAARLEGFEFIGIERDDTYFEIAKERIGKAMANVQLDNAL